MCYRNLISSLDSRNPADLTGGAVSQSPNYGDDATNSLAVDVSDGMRRYYYYYDYCYITVRNAMIIVMTLSAKTVA